VWLKLRILLKKSFSGGKMKKYRYDHVGDKRKLSKIKKLQKGERGKSGVFKTTFHRGIHKGGAIF